MGRFIETLERRGMLAGGSAGAEFAVEAGEAVVAAVESLLPTDPVVVTSDASGTIVGLPMTYRAKVTSPAGVPTGVVEFYYQTWRMPTPWTGGPYYMEPEPVLIGAGTLDANGEAAVTAAAPRVGRMTISARYVSDGTFAAAQTSAINIYSVGIGPRDIRLRVEASATTVTIGEPVTFSGTILDETPGVEPWPLSGIVRIVKNEFGWTSNPFVTSPTPQAPLVDGRFEITGTIPVAGAHEVYAHMYLPEMLVSPNNYPPQVAVAVPVTVVTATPRVELSVEQTGPEHALVARVTSPDAAYAPTGTVRFVTDRGQHWDAPLVDGIARVTRSASFFGTYVATANYLGDAMTSAAASAALPISIELPRTRTTLIVPARPVLPQVGSSATPSRAFTVHGRVTVLEPQRVPGGPVGSVRIVREGSDVVLATAAVAADGSYEATLSLREGTHRLVARYVKVGAIQGSESAPQEVTARRYATTAAPIEFDPSGRQPWHVRTVITSAVRGVAPTGEAALYVDGRRVSTTYLTAGKNGKSTAVFRLAAPLLPGVHRLTVKYLGSGTHLGTWRSQALRARRTATIVLGSEADVGRTRLTARVTGPADSERPTGRVTFYRADGTRIGDVGLGDGTASLFVRGPESSFYVIYGGDSRYEARLWKPSTVIRPLA